MHSHTWFATISCLFQARTCVLWLTSSATTTSVFPCTPSVTSMTIVETTPMKPTVVSIHWSIIFNSLLLTGLYCINMFTVKRWLESDLRDGSSCFRLRIEQCSKNWNHFLAVTHFLTNQDLFYLNYNKLLKDIHASWSKQKIKPEKSKCN